jgi:membrane fusion protein (multidrug efflux system)
VADNAILVPQVGVTHDPQGQASALVVAPDGKVASRPLQLRGTHGDEWIVDSGLVEGDRVIVAGLQNARPGAQVRATESQPAAVVSLAK